MIRTYAKALSELLIRPAQLLDPAGKSETVEGAPQ
jgi:hypothetical protein